ncbi:hypothetical protein [Paeniglutamicibacter psychrophenolicus]|uniref:hypothetical protein n=1 Tax=Paeniglutamicibacter psychrophenolicus TaxID=257454 RepID=UPI00359422BA
MRKQHQEDGRQEQETRHHAEGNGPKVRKGCLDARWPQTRRAGQRRLSSQGRRRRFQHHGAGGRRLGSPRTLECIRKLAIPPVWTDLWISASPEAHILATGVEAAGRTQYIHHPRWHEARGEAMFLRSPAFARRLPAIRRRVSLDLQSTSDPRLRALAAAVRLMDRPACAWAARSMPGRTDPSAPPRCSSAT